MPHPLETLLLALALTLAPARARAGDLPSFQKVGLAPRPIQFGADWCSLNFNQIRYSKDSLGEALKELPDVRKMILAMMDDPLVPRQTKEIVKRGLQDQKAEIRNLNDQLKKAWNVPDGFAGFAVRGGDRPYLISGREWKVRGPVVGTQNEVLSKAVRPGFQGTYGVAVPDEPVDEFNNSLITLIHELAHIRLESYLRKNIEVLAERLPPTLTFVDKATGKHALNSELLDLLHERYAFESEYKAFRATHGRYFTAWKSRYRKEDADLSETEMGPIISDLVVNLYHITDPVVRAVAAQPLRQLLSGGGALAQEVNAVTYFITSPLHQRSIAEFELAYALAEEGLLRNGVIERPGPPAFEALASLKLVISEGRDGVLKILPFLLDRFRGTQGERVILEFMERDEVRRMLARKLDWRLPSRKPLTVLGAMESHPGLRDSLNQDPFSFSNRTQQAIADLLRRRGSVARVPKAEEGFEAALGQAEHGRMIANYVRSFKDVYSTPLRSGREPASRLYSLLELDPEKPEDYWSRLGLKNEFQKAYPDPSKFLDSGDSLVEVYRRLAVSSADP